jgi:hypothetical protein
MGSLPDDAAPVALIAMIQGAWTSQAIHVAARLGIADVLAAGPRTSEDVAAHVGADAHATFRLLRALETLGLCRERPDDHAFELTPLGSHLRSDSDASLRAFALHWGGGMWPLWATLLHTVKSGKSPRALVSPRESFEDLGRDSHALHVFNEAMSEVSRLLAAGAVRAYDFSRFGRLVDVGGGHGELLGAIVQAHPGMRGILFDLPRVLDGASKHLAALGVADRCELVPGSFFESVPDGADAYLLKSVLHDWPDERAAVILANCRRAMSGRSTLLVVERVVPERMDVSAEHRLVVASDLAMMVAVSGRERTEAEFRGLLRAAGFATTRVVPAPLGYRIIEAACA